jgi:hypothetical protein
MCINVRIQLALGLKRKYSFSHFRENSLRILTKIAETLMMWTSWGMGHKIE